MKKFSVLSLGLVLLVACASREKSPASLSHFAVPQTQEQRQNYEASGTQYVVATQGQAATVAAQRIYEAGGNIIDAAVAASFAISVERPQSTGLGGGGFLLFKEAKSGKVYAVDFRERAPLKATEKMFLDEKGEVVKGKSTAGIFAVGVPGLVAGLLTVHRRFGKLPRAKIMQPAIDLAENGFPVYPYLADALKDTQALLAKYPASAKIFLKADGTPYKVGEILVQKDLAKSLQLIARQGASAFYRGAIGKAIVEESTAQNGLLSMQDLAQYQVKWRKPVRGTYKGFEIWSMPPPSSGGTHVVEILNIIEKDNLAQWGYGSPEALHLTASAMQQAFADRATFMGDPDFYRGIPLKGLLSKAYGESVRKTISLEQVKKADDVKSGEPQKYESPETTHFSIMDRAGNAVVSTQTINGWMGSAVTVPGTGILLNNEMDDFAAKPGAANLFGAIGGVPNSIAPQKTPLSSMSPTLVEKNSKVVLALGAPGGTRIITCVAQTILNYLEFKLPLYESVANVRFHQQWRPDQLDIEAPGLGEKVTSALRAKGHNVVVRPIGCKVNAVAREGENLRGVADPRDLGSVWAQ